MGDVVWPVAVELGTGRLLLEPVAPRYAMEMVEVLAPVELYRFTGGQPPTVADLRMRYARQSVGHSPDGKAGWLNWIIRFKDDGRAVGYVQATVTERSRGFEADLAWLVTPSAQHGGVAYEAARAMRDWLVGQRVLAVKARIRPDHVASAGVARRLGLQPTDVEIEGELLWR